jgi:hypothetical protein
VVSCVGLTCAVPLSAGVPVPIGGVIVTAVAFAELHVTVTDCPSPTEVGLTLMLAVGCGGGGGGGGDDAAPLEPHPVRMITAAKMKAGARNQSLAEYFIHSSRDRRS